MGGPIFCTTLRTAELLLISRHDGRQRRGLTVSPLIPDFKTFHKHFNGKMLFIELRPCLSLRLEGDVSAEHVVEEDAERPHRRSVAAVPTQTDPLRRRVDKRAWKFIRILNVLLLLIT